MGNARETSSAQSAGAERARQPPNGVAESDPFVELHQTAGNQALLRLLAGGAQRKPKLSRPADDFEQQADLIAAHIPSNPSGLMVQRKCAACAVGAPCSACAPEEENETVQFKRTGLMVQRASREGTADSQPATAQSDTKAAPTKAGPSLIVEDDAKDLNPGQMRKTEFISQLRTAACSAAEEALAGTMWSAMGCPYIQRWLDHYSKQSSVQQRMSGARRSTFHSSVRNYDAGSNNGELPAKLPPICPKSLPAAKCRE
jgi:hypothetical protein